MPESDMSTVWWADVARNDSTSLSLITLHIHATPTRTDSTKPVRDVARDHVTARN